MHSYTAGAQAELRDYVSMQGSSMPKLGERRGEPVRQAQTACHIPACSTQGNNHSPLCLNMGACASAGPQAQPCAESNSRSPPLAPQLRSLPPAGRADSGRDCTHP